MARNVVEEYLYQLSPEIDTKAVKKTDKEFEKIMDSFSKKNKQVEDAIGASYDDAIKLEEKIKKPKKNLLDTESLSKFAAQAKVVYETLEKIWGVIVDINEQARQLSNQMITIDSAFVDSDIRDIMIRLGVSDVEARGLENAMDRLGISVDEFALLTEGQRKQVSEMTQFYIDAYDSIDQKQLEQYNKALQNQQIILAKTDLELEIAKQKALIAFAPTFEAANELITNSVELLTKVLDSQAFKNALSVLNYGTQAFVEALTYISDSILWIVDKLEWAFDLGKGKVDSTTNNVTVNQNNNTTNYGSSGNQPMNNELLIAQVKDVFN